MIYLVKIQSEVPHKPLSLHRMNKNQYELSVKNLISGDGKEYIAKQLHIFLKTESAMHETPFPRTLP